MLGLYGFLMDPAFEKRQRERDKRDREERLAQGGVPWDFKLKWQPRLTLKADTWLTWDLFDVEPTKHHNPNLEEDESKFVLSPSGQFMFCRKTLKRGECIATMNGSKTGNVMFDATTYIPALHERARGYKAERQQWEDNPWMSITPNELLTQRPGIRFAKGHTVVAGLGLGWALMMIRLKRTVTKVTLVEKSQELVDWLLTSGRIEEVGMRSLAPKGGKLAPLEVVVGDAYEVVPKMTADVAVIDIFSSYGSNDFLEDIRYGRRAEGLTPNERRCAGIGRVWSWGKANVRDSYW